jgi:hypothetical protein
MKQASSAPIREGSWLTGRTTGLMIGFAAIWMAPAPVAWGQWNTCGTAECITSGNVGIGTTTPGAPLEVYNPSAGLLGIFTAPTNGSVASIQVYGQYGGAIDLDTLGDRIFLACRAAAYPAYSTCTHHRR